MNRLLFVDDDPRLIQGLRRVLLTERRRWRMDFAVGPQEALELLGLHGYDLVCSDMRMPGLDGSEVLRRVRRAQPTAIRLILSGHSDEGAAVEAAGVAHAFLHKPCDRDRLRRILAQVASLHARPTPRSTRAWVGALERLPLQASTLRRLESRLGEGEVTASAVVDVVERDPCLGAKVLQLVQGSFFGPQRPVDSVEEALGVLGLPVLRRLLLSPEIFAARPAAIGESARRDPGNHALEVARLARHLVVDPALADQAYLAGLLHDLGDLLVSAVGAGEEPSAGDRMPGGPEDHAARGAHLLETWFLPEALVRAVAGHHRRGGGPFEGPVAAALWAAEALVEDRPERGDCTAGDLLPSDWEERGAAFLDSHRREAHP